jgi:hypothetical protein
MPGGKSVGMRLPCLMKPLPSLLVATPGGVGGPVPLEHPAKVVATRDDRKNPIRMLELFRFFTSSFAFVTVHRVGHDSGSVNYPRIAA